MPNYPPKINPEKEARRILQFIKETFKSVGKGGAVVAVSGGIDSATSLFLATKAVGPKQVYALHLPSKTTPREQTALAQEAIAAAGIPQSQVSIIPITGCLQKTWRAIGRHSQLPKPKAVLPSLNRLRMGNLQLRLRMSIIFDQAKVLDALVVGTENLSERLLGYFTRFGDEASDVEPIRHLYKTQVYQLAKYLKLPKTIINNPPSANMWRGQSDEDELGFSYAAADPILYLFEQGKTQEEITKLNYPQKLVIEVFNWVEKNRFKQEVPFSLI